MSKPILEIQNMSCGYGEQNVLENISFSVKKKEFLGIIGPNASGKSTLLRAIDRVIELNDGTISLDQNDMAKMDKKEIARKISVVPQEFSTNYSFSVLDMVTLGRTPHLEPLEVESEEDMTIIKKAMKMTKTWKLADRSFTELSGGEKQRVVVAKALAQEPSLLLLDEPINHLDINKQQEILDLLKNLSEEEDKTIISTFHDLNKAARYCNSLILLHNKKIHSKGPPGKVLSEENIREVYGTEVSIRRKPETDSISVTPFSVTLTSAEEESLLKIHLICGGGTGKALMSPLLRRGHRLTAGVVSQLDDDYREARRLGISLVESSPFSRIGEKAIEENRKMIEQSDLVIITDMPIGKGNLKNLELANQAAKNKPVLIVGETPISERDFTDGKATEIFSTLEERSVKTVKDVEEALKFLEEHDFSNHSKKLS